ncbi:cell division site-positioning protein MapZ family protein [Streptococcus sp. ST14]
MSKKRRDRHKKGHQEPQFDFDEAKDLTVGQVIRKNEEVEAGVLPEDSILDKYIKQHREEIEADKFETRQFKKEELASTQNLEEMIQEVRESSESSDQVDDSDVVAEESIEEIENEETTQFVPPLQDEENAEIESLVLTETEPKEINEERDEETYTPLSRSAQTEPETGSKKKGVIIIASVVAAILVLAGTYYVYRQVSRSNQEIQSSQAASSDDQGTQTALKDFNDLYDTFYTDANKTALKNSQFDKLSQLKTLLDKLEGSRDYTLAKSRYDSLATQIKAIQDVNALFESPAITDGVLDTNAKAKADAKFTEIKTGNTELDKLLDKAISLGKSQQTSASSSSSSSSTSQASSNTTSEAKPSSSNETRSSRGEVNMGLSSAGVAVQRSASRVAYNQSAIDDSNNSAWDFADGVLEQILATSRSRGYITGDQYILERVNIVNGNGYYNLYKPDGTYLFTLNCKTGYFVGNGAGHADDLDY